MAPIQRLLVANRGEIALRVIRTAKHLGIDSVAVFSDADQNEPFVRAADQAVRLGPPPASASYLDIDRILSAARLTHADAVHPGYGFLSENAIFADAVTNAGLTFVGPPARVLREMGDKRRARQRAVLAGVPVVPGYDGDDQDDERLIEEARRIGLPVLVKASAGGGGKGMLVVRRFDDLQAALESARRVAKAAFGDDTLLLERYLDHPRHVEIQIFGDKLGNVTHLFERECSIQRRHQKIIEESPSTALDDALRDAMTSAAVRLGKAIGYENAGTVEMLVGPRSEFYFLEVNTRLQVEHPVTEAVLGVDLVEAQIRVAEGKALPFGGKRPSGSAIECRLYAEDPRTLLPSTGRIRDFHVPEGVRSDAGVTVGSEVGIHYDPLLAKLVAYAPDRPEAIRKMLRTLRELSVHGVTTNRTLLMAILSEPDFADGRIDTHFIDTHPAVSEPMTTEPMTSELPERAAMALLLHCHELRRSSRPLDVPSGYRNSRYRDVELTLGFVAPDRTTHDLVMTYRATAKDRFVVSVGGARGELRLLSFERLEGVSRVHFIDPNGVAYRARVSVDGELDDTEVRAASVHLAALGQAELMIMPRFPHAERTHNPGDHVAPMPGRVVRVAVAAGQAVEKGQVLVVLEAMKMEQSVRATRSGRVRTVEVAVGDQVEPDALLVTLTDENP
ncbi:MAG: biotin/lipoyl-binding protein [Deltaproteobacteria bacterium]|nr:biotin/lipoyl-binding protein [Deltaproteobacteria bacterium]